MTLKRPNNITNRSTYQHLLLFYVQASSSQGHAPKRFSGRGLDKSSRSPVDREGHDFTCTEWSGELHFHTEGTVMLTACWLFKLASALLVTHVLFRTLSRSWSIKRTLHPRWRRSWARPRTGTARWAGRTTAVTWCCPNTPTRSTSWPTDGSASRPSTRPGNHKYCWTNFLLIHCVH